MIHNRSHKAEQFKREAAKNQEWDTPRSAVVVIVTLILITVYNNNTNNA